MGKYTSISTTQQTDESVNVGEASKVAGAGAVLSEPGSFIVGQEATVGDVVYNQFPEEVRDTFQDMIEAVETTVSGSVQSQQQATQAVASALETQQRGGDVVLTDVAKYAVLALALYLLGRAWL